MYISARWRGAAKQVCTRLYTHTVLLDRAGNLPCIHVEGSHLAGFKVQSTFPKKGYVLCTVAIIEVSYYSSERSIIISFCP